VEKNQNIEKIAGKFVHLCSRLCNIHSQKYMFYIFMVGNLQNIFIDGRKEKSIILTSAIYCWLLLLVTGFVIQGHICVSYLFAKS